MTMQIGFIGFGEVAAVFSERLRSNGAEIAVFDVLLTKSDGMETLRKRAKTEEIRFCSIPELIESTDFILSTVTTQAAKEVAAECAGYLEPGRTFVDLNSTAPTIKVELNAIIQSTGANFVEGAILGAIGAAGADVPILIGGKEGKKMAENLSDLGLSAVHYDDEIGKASMFKMLRSIFSKGLEALIAETLIAGKRAGIEHDLWRDICEFMMNNPFDKVASNWIRSHASAYERRFHEMVQVVETMQELGVKPLMTSATLAFFERSLSLGLKEAFQGNPHSMEQVIDQMERGLKPENL